MLSSGKILGCRVVGLAGSAEKCTWLTKELGFDAAINYREGGLEDALRAACPKGCDVFFDNVGGTILDAALTVINQRSRVVLCGAISQYNSEKVEGPSNYLALLKTRSTMQGFIVLDFFRKYGEAHAQLAQWIADGKLRWRVDVVKGLENAPTALLKLFDGSNLGKLAVQVSAVPEGSSKL